MENIKVSVVMPCLNSAVYIGKAIESVLKQDLTELELIVVDAGSTDGTLEIVEKYRKEDDRIVVLESEKKSLGYQYNKGIQFAKGKYVGFVESDDFIHHQMYQRLYETAEENQVDFVKSDFDLFMGDGEKRITLNYSILTTYYNDLYNTVIDPRDHPWILYHDMNMWNGLYDRSFLLQNQISLNQTPGAAFQDMGFVFQTFIKAEKVIYVQQTSYYYRRDNENASQYNRTRHMQFVIDELNYIWKYMAENKITVPFRGVIFRRCFIHFTQLAGYYLCEESSIEKRSDIKGYLDILLTCYDSMDYPEKRGENLDESVWIYTLKLGKSEFEAVVKCSYKANKYAEKEFFDFIKTHKFVIFGVSEQGKALLALCYMYHIEDNVIGFCDNDKRKQGKKIFGKVCKTPYEYFIESSRQSQEIYYVITTVIWYEEMKEQLLKMGVSRARIIHCIEWVQTQNVMGIEKEKV